MSIFTNSFELESYRKSSAETYFILTSNRTSVNKFVPRPWTAWMLTYLNWLSVIRYFHMLPVNNKRRIFKIISTGELLVNLCVLFYVNQINPDDVKWLPFWWQSLTSHHFRYIHKPNKIPKVWPWLVKVKEEKNWTSAIRLEMFDSI